MAGRTRSLSGRQVSKMNDEIIKRLAELAERGDTSSDATMMTEYIMVMIQNNKSKQEVAKDLDAFLGSDAEEFAEWLWLRLAAVQSADDATLADEASAAAAAAAAAARRADPQARGAKGRNGRAAGASRPTTSRIDSPHETTRKPSNVPSSKSPKRPRGDDAKEEESSSAGKRGRLQEEIEEEKRERQQEWEEWELAQQARGGGSAPPSTDSPSTGGRGGRAARAGGTKGGRGGRGGRGGAPLSLASAVEPGTPANDAAFTITMDGMPSNQAITKPAPPFAGGDGSRHRLEGGGRGGGVGGASAYTRGLALAAATKAAAAAVEGVLGAGKGAGSY